MNVAVISDNIQQSKLLADKIRLIHPVCKVEIISSPELYLENLQQSAYYDMLFLDLDEHPTVCIRLVQMVEENFPKTLVVCITSSISLILKCNEYVWKYIIKPYRNNDIKQSLEKAQRLLAPCMLLIPSSSEKGHFIMNVHNIIYFEIFDKCGVIHTRDLSQQSFRASLCRLERALENNYFFRSHKSYLLNIEYIRYITDDTITMLDGTQLPLSRNRKNDLYKILSSHPEIIFT